MATLQQMPRRSVRTALPAVLMAILALVLAVGGGAGPWAAGEARAEDGVVRISSAEDWLRFAENCREDAYSRGLNVELAADIDLKGAEGAAVPVFCGEFDGKGHALAGFLLDTDADMQGLFRLVDEGASIRDLRVEGYVVGGGESGSVGILCGVNRGLIERCAVGGAVGGHEDVGSVAGVNDRTGTIAECSSEARVAGTYRVGGIAGTNNGTVEGCGNVGSVNAAPDESATSVGGIAGLNAGAIEGCANAGDVGYLHTGYNVGGIAGLSRGFVQDSPNDGAVFGRRDVGGIVGQMEPSFNLEFGQNSIEMLESDASQLVRTLNSAMGSLQAAIDEGAADLSGVLSRVSGFASSLAGDASALFSNATWISDAGTYISAIREELESMSGQLPDSSAPADQIRKIEDTLNDFDEGDPDRWRNLLGDLSADLGRLSEQLEGYAWLQEGMARIADSFDGLATTVIGGIRQFGDEGAEVLENASAELAGITDDLSGLMDGIDQGLGPAWSEAASALSSLGGLRDDVDAVLGGRTDATVDVSEDLVRRADGVIADCANEAGVSGDYNAGGIVGNLSTELSLDQENDILSRTIGDALFTDTVTYVRATVYRCSNSGAVETKYADVGGIVGGGTQGALVECLNNGNVAAGTANAGGIVGSFRGTVRACASIGAVDGESHVGGIAGSAQWIEDCMAIPLIEARGAYVGSIAGAASGTCRNNLFVGDALGGVDGISREGQAQAVTYGEMTALEGSPDIFRKLAVSYVVDGELLKKVPVDYGGRVDGEPVVEQQDGMYWQWDDYEREDIRVNQVVGGSWRNLITTIASEGDEPLFLVEGQFDDSARLEAIAAQGEAADGAAGVQAYSLAVSGFDGDMLTVRYRTDDEGGLRVSKGDAMVDAAYRRDGRYIVFEMENGGDFTFVPGHRVPAWVLPALAALAVAVVVAAVAVFAGRRKAKLQKDAS